MKNVKSINPGRFNKKVDVYRYTDIETDMGSQRTVLAKAETVWAEVRPTRGTEFLEYYRDANALQFKVTMRYRPGLTEKDVLVYKGRQFEINSVINILEADLYMEVYCTESKDKKVLYEEG
ncbi:MAG: phage head closure protein [Eubacterium sp.]|nr:phage head closure protein [Candidatus Colimonas fimequi]